MSQHTHGRVAGYVPPDAPADPALSVIEQRRAAIIARMRATGTLCAEGERCPTCTRAIAHENPANYMMPAHRCRHYGEPGHNHPHCTADTCF